MIAKDQAGSFSMADVSSRYLMNADHTMGFSYFSESFRKSPWSPTPSPLFSSAILQGQSPVVPLGTAALPFLPRMCKTCKQKPSCEDLGSGSGAKAKYHRPTANTQQPLFFLLKFLAFSQYTEVSKINFGRRVCYLILPRCVLAPRGWFSFRILTSSI